jgi:hypothetical protein
MHLSTILIIEHQTAVRINLFNLSDIKLVSRSGAEKSIEVLLNVHAARLAAVEANRAGRKDDFSSLRRFCVFDV